MQKKHIVKSGETLSHIAQSELGKASFWPLFLDANPHLKEADRYNEKTSFVLIKVGEELIVPVLGDAPESEASALLKAL